MPTTARGIRYPVLTDTANVPRDVANLAADVDGLMDDVDARTTLAAVTGITDIDAAVSNLDCRKVGDQVWLRLRFSGPWAPAAPWSSRPLLTLHP